jgi:outer membrane receptor protein involved in Fe transport
MMRGFHEDRDIAASHRRRGKFNNAYGPLDISDNSVSGRLYLNTSLGYTVLENGTMNVQLFGKIDNLLDKDPPITPDAGVQPLAANSPHYDRIGRSYALGARFKF